MSTQNMAKHGAHLSQETGATWGVEAWGELSIPAAHRCPPSIAIR